MWSCCVLLVTHLVNTLVAVVYSTVCYTSRPGENFAREDPQTPCQEYIIDSRITHGIYRAVICMSVKLTRELVKVNIYLPNWLSYKKTAVWKALGTDLHVFSDWWILTKEKRKRLFRIVVSGDHSSSSSAYRSWPPDICFSYCTLLSLMFGFSHPAKISKLRRQ